MDQRLAHGNAGRLNGPVSSPSWVRRAYSLRALVYALVTTLVLLVVVIALATTVGRLQVASAERDLRETVLPAKTAVAELSTAYVDQETGQRGFLLTGQEAFLAPYESGQASAVRLQRRLADLLADDPRGLALLDQVTAGADRWRSQTVTPAIDARRAGDPTAGAAQAERARQLFDAVRADLGRLADRTTQLTQQELDQISSAQRRANVITGVALVLALAAAVAAVPLLGPLVIGPLERLLGQVQSVATGEYDRPIAGDGPVELVAMGTAVETMRVSMVHRSDELADARESLTLRDERDRMAADLHDLTIQRVFGLGLSLSSTVARRPDLGPLLDPLIDETDDIIRELRGVIFGIRHDAAGPGGLRTRVTDLAADSSRALGFSPRLSFDGPVDSVVDDQVAAEVLAVVREALSNVSRHAHATSVTVDVSLLKDELGPVLSVTVADDGVGIGRVPRVGHGMENLRQRAARLGGTLDVAASSASGGTRLCWQVPLPSGEPTHDDDEE
jgi:signal transduction histidine kinase